MHTCQVFNIHNHLSITVPLSPLENQLPCCFNVGSELNTQLINNHELFVLLLLKLTKDCKVGLIDGAGATEEEIIMFDNGNALGDHVFS